MEYVRPLSNLEIYEKQTAVFECEISKPNQTAKWFQAGSEVTGPDFDRFTPEVDGTVHRLTIVDAILDDTMKYACVVKEKKTSAKLTVLGKEYTFLMIILCFISVEMYSDRQCNSYHVCFIVYNIIFQKLIMLVVYIGLMINRREKIHVSFHIM